MTHVWVSLSDLWCCAVSVKFAAIKTISALVLHSGQLV